MNKMMTFWIKTAPALIGLSLGVFAPTLHATPKIEQLAKSGRWTAYKMVEGGETYCYMQTTPISSTGAYDKRGAVNLLITHIPHLKSTNIIEFQAGYPFHAKKEVFVTVGKKKHILFTDGEGAWCAPDGISDKNLTTDILRQPGTLQMFGTSRKGTETKDTYSLAGAMVVYGAICKACSVKSVLAEVQDNHTPAATTCAKPSQGLKQDEKTAPKTAAHKNHNPKNKTPKAMTQTGKQTSKQMGKQLGKQMEHKAAKKPTATSKTTGPKASTLKAKKSSAIPNKTLIN